MAAIIGRAAQALHGVPAGCGGVARAAESTAGGDQCVRVMSWTNQVTCEMTCDDQVTRVRRVMRAVARACVVSPARAVAMRWVATLGGEGYSCGVRVQCDGRIQKGLLRAL